MLEIAQALEPRMWRLLMVSIFGLLGTALFVYLLWPQVQAYRSASQTFSVLSAAVSKEETLDKEIEDVRQNVFAMADALHGDMANLPRNQLEAFVVGRMQDVSWRHNIELRSVRPGPGSRIKVFDEVLFSVEVSGEYFDIYGWLEDLNDDLGFVIVRRFELKPIASDRQMPVLIANFTMVAYQELDDDV